MSTNHLNCPLCLKNVSWPCYYKHFFSVQHMGEFVKPAILKEKSSHAIWRKGTKKSSLPIIYIKEEPIVCCFGCKKAKSYMPSDHLSTCPDADKHLDTLKGMLECVNESEVVVSTIEVDALKKQIEKLKRQLADAEKELEKNVDFEEERDTFIKSVCGTDYFTFIDEYKGALEDDSFISYKELVNK